MRPRIPVADRFWAKVQKSEGCWLWTGGKCGRGYGNFTISNNKTENSHRVAFKLAKGPIAPGLCVCHTCDNPACVRPDHLFLGTASDNAKDCVAKGRNNPHKPTHCKHGHEFTLENTCIRANGTGRKCRECGRSSAKQRDKARWIAVQFKKFRPLDLPKAA